jgi:endonuclease YncB( thermonuclease family)
MSNLLNKMRSRSNNPRKIFSLGKLLLFFFLISLLQFVQTGNVTWVTDTFRWFAGGKGIEQTGGKVKDIARQVEDTVQRRAPEDLQKNRHPDAQISWSAQAYDLTGRVVRVADGDTLTILDSKQKKHKIRLFGIDSPESQQPYYKAAGKALSRLTSGKDVDVVIKDTDSYGRTVGVIYLDNIDINLEMVTLGYAWWYRRFARSDEDLKQAEQFARSRKLGLWGDPDPIAPWDWRRSQRNK